ncbi:transposase [Streptomyces sp. NPDC016845]|uniref:transposase n=1 Tax=Streptomyces sp. NPDC016845 TaxID=3364972 RepID=UPI0037A61FB7
MTAPADRAISVIAPVRPNSTPQQVRAAGFGRSAFTIDRQGMKAICPSGQNSRYWTAGLDSNGRDAIRIRFATTTCAPCPVREQCTRSTQYGRQLTVRPQDQDALLERVRTEQTTNAWKERHAARAGIEGTNNQAVAVTGMRRTRYLGLAKTHLGHVLAAPAVNLVRLDAWRNDTPLARTRTSRLAALKLSA